MNISIILLLFSLFIYRNVNATEEFRLEKLPTCEQSVSKPSLKKATQQVVLGLREIQSPDEHKGSATAGASCTLRAERLPKDPPNDYQKGAKRLIKFLTQQNSFYDPKKAEEWMNANPIEVRPILKKLLQGVQVIPEHEFMQALQTLLNKFFEKIKDKPYVLVVEFTDKKSTVFWAGFAQASLLPRAPKAIIRVDKVLAFEAAHKAEEIEYLYLDDLSLTANQIEMNLIDEGLSMHARGPIPPNALPHRVHVGVVAATPVAKTRLEGVIPKDNLLIGMGLKNVNDLISADEILQLQQSIQQGKLGIEETVVGRQVFMNTYKTVDAMSMSDVLSDGRVWSTDGTVKPSIPFFEQNAYPFYKDFSSITFDEQGLAHYHLESMVVSCAAHFAKKYLEYNGEEYQIKKEYAGKAIPITLVASGLSKSIEFLYGDKTYSVDLP